APRAIAEDDQVISLWPLVSWREQASELRLRAKHREQHRRDPRPIQFGGAELAGDRHGQTATTDVRKRVDRAHTGERAASLAESKNERTGHTRRSDVGS